MSSSPERAPRGLSPGAITLGLGGLAVGYLIKSVGTRRTIQFAQERASRMEELANRDPLTGLYNRRAMADAYRGLQAAHQRTTDGRSNGQTGAKAEQHSLILLDIDHFKEFNDKQGHEKGDRVLCTVADILMTRDGRARQRDIPVRVGGEEMALLLPRATVGKAADIAEDLHALVLKTGEITASFGVVELDLERSLEYNVDLADQALYAAKQQGRNQVVVYPPQPGNIAA